MYGSLYKLPASRTDFRVYNLCQLVRHISKAAFVRILILYGWQKAILSAHMSTHWNHSLASCAPTHSSFMHITNHNYFSMFRRYVFIESQVSMDSEANDSNDYKNTQLLLWGSSACEAPRPSLCCPNGVCDLRACTES